MKKLITGFILIFLTLTGVQTYAQKFGIQGGINLSKLLIKDNDATYSDQFKSNLGFNAGVTLGIGLSKLIDIEAGAIVESRGYKVEEQGYVGKMNLLYADIPVLLKVGPALGPVKIFGAAGPYVGIGLVGKTTSEYDGEKTSEDVTWGSNDENLKRIDYGAKFGIGAELMKFTFGAYYSLGLANLTNIKENGSKVQNRGISVCVGLKF